MRDAPFDPGPYQKELDALLHQFGRKIGTLITEPYLGGGGSYHPPKAYLQLLERFCRGNDIVFILDEVQSNFGRTGSMFAFETYGLEPDIVVLGKGLGNGVPVAAAVGRAEIFSALDYGEGSDTWSANPLCCAAVLATLDEFEAYDVLGAMKPVSAIDRSGPGTTEGVPLCCQCSWRERAAWSGVSRCKTTPAAPRRSGRTRLSSPAIMGTTARAMAIHLLGPLSKKVIRVAPPLTITMDEAAAAHRNHAPRRATTRQTGVNMPVEWMSSAVAWLADTAGTELFVMKGLLAVLLVCGLCGMVGSMVVGNRMAFFSDTMAHTAFAGVTLGFLSVILAGGDKESITWVVPLVMVACGVAAGVGMVYIRDQTGLANDTVIGVFFAAAIGFGAMLFQVLSVKSNFNPENFLFGNLTFIPYEDLVFLLGLVVVVVPLYAWRYNQLVFASFNPTLGRTRGLTMKLNNYLFIILLALVVNLSIKAVGALLINALLVVPAAAAMNLSRNAPPNVLVDGGILRRLGSDRVRTQELF